VSESKVKQLRHIPEHVHCHDCGCAVAPDDARQGGTVQAMPGPDGRVGFAMRPVFLCGGCWERVSAAEQAAQQRPKIEVARAMPPKGLRPA